MSCAKRLQQELMQIMMSKDSGVSAFPEGDNLMKWTGFIVGPKDTPYEGIKFKMSMNYPDNYPFKPPVVKFVTPIFHPNVDAKGTICLDILNTKWTAVYNTLSCLQSIQSLLGDPNNDDPLNLKARNMWKNQNDFRREVMATSCPVTTKKSVQDSSSSSRATAQ